ncbi:MAG: hypothetical protein BroJett003_23710 [Planctomycetota bacterium]|nr:MAG: hypothetical protein BroJett003_23710 [Planctomycetota bacterium]
MTTTASTGRADVVIVGGGAAGLATAIFIARRAPDLRIVIFDAAPKLGAKILVSGGGRCNVTNVRVTPRDFNGGSPNVVKNVLAAFDERRTVEFFRELGVGLHEEDWGKLFPDSNDAHTVVKALLDETRRLSVRILERRRVVRVEPRADGFLIATQPAGPPPLANPPTFADPAAPRDDGTWIARRVVLATGGQSLPKTGSDGFGYELARRLGHTIVPTTPALVPLLLDGDFHIPLPGIAQEVEIKVRVAKDRPVRIVGPLLWTHFGVSGPAVLDASRCWHRAVLDQRPVAVTINLLPGRDLAAAEHAFLDLAARQPRIAVATALANFVPARVADAVVNVLGIPARVTLANFDRTARRRLLAAILDWPLPVRGSRGYNYAEVTAGGVALNEIDPGTLASRRCPGLSLVGEILDVDGRIGGFNFQWAWSTGYVAAQHLAELSRG